MYIKNIYFLYPENLFILHIKHISKLKIKAKKEVKFNWVNYVSCVCICMVTWGLVYIHYDIYDESFTLIKL